MPSEQYLDYLQSTICDEKKIVTYKWLAMDYDVPSDTAKKMLFTFAKKFKKKVKVIYFVSGVLKEDGSLCVKLASEDRLEEIKDLYSELSSVHVYSVQKTIPKSGDQLATVDREKLLSLYQDPESIKRLEQGYSHIVFNPKKIGAKFSSSGVVEPIKDTASQQVRNKKELDSKLKKISDAKMASKNNKKSNQRDSNQSSISLPVKKEKSRKKTEKKEKPSRKRKIDDVKSENEDTKSKEQPKKKQKNDKTSKKVAQPKSSSISNFFSATTASQQAKAFEKDKKEVESLKKKTISKTSPEKSEVSTKNTKEKPTARKRLTKKLQLDSDSEEEPLFDEEESDDIFDDEVSVDEEMSEEENNDMEIEDEDEEEEEEEEKKPEKKKRAKRENKEASSPKKKKERKSSSKKKIVKDEVESDEESNSDNEDIKKKKQKKKKQYVDKSQKKIGFTVKNSEENKENEQRPEPEPGKKWVQIKKAVTKKTADGTWITEDQNIWEQVDDIPDSQNSGKSVKKEFTKTDFKKTQTEAKKAVESHSKQSNISSFFQK